MGYIHLVDKNRIPTVDIMGVNIAAIDMDWLVSFTKSHITELSGDYICVSNVHTTVMSYENGTYREIQNGGIMAIPDGGPLVTLGRRRGADHIRRTTGPDFMEEILQISEENGYRHFFLGATTQTLDRMSIRIKETYPKVKIAGLYSPPFRPLTEDEDKEIVEMINNVSADFVWIGLGAPKQEQWMAKHQGKVKGLMVGVGAAFDYFAGNIQRAPVWMQKANLEWLYRLMQDPKRLFKRYLITNSKFLWNAVVKGK